MLRIESLSAGYGRVPVLDRVSLSLAKLEVVAVLGTNGAGKSTLLRTLSGLVARSEGTIVLDGEEISDLPPWTRLKRGLAHVPEGRQIFPNMTVREHLDLAAEVVQRQGTTFDASYVFDLFPRLSERSAQRAGTLSGGEQQMLAIGRALMSNPSVLMLDEPSHGLAPVVVDQLAEKIREIAQLVTVLLVEQNLALPRAVASRFVVLDNGKVELSGGAEDLMSDEVVERAYFGVRVHDMEAASEQQ